MISIFGSCFYFRKSEALPKSLVSCALSFRPNQVSENFEEGEGRGELVRRYVRGTYIPFANKFQILGEIFSSTRIVGAVKTHPGKPGLVCFCH